MSLRRQPAPGVHRRGGFTLIELLVVVAVLSAASLLAFGVFAEDRTQIRYDDTRTRLNILRKSILGQIGPSTVATVGGFVTDNGDLPGDVATLMQSGTLLAQSAQTPVFDPQPDAASCANNGTEFPNPFGTSADANALLIKGHRGDYLGGMGVNGHFRDGWGNVAPDASVDMLNSGWHVVLDTTNRSLTIASLGTDNVSGGVDFAADMATTLPATDWLVPLQGWSINLNKRYKPAADMTINLSVSLLVFQNTTTGGRWLRYSTPIVSACFDGDGDGLVGGLPCNTVETLSFGATCNPDVGTSAASAIPQGRHLLVVTAHTGAALWATTDSPFWSSAKQAMARIDAVAGMPLPPIELVLR